MARVLVRSVPVKAKILELGRREGLFEDTPEEG
jgi:hypothetical protein